MTAGFEHMQLGRDFRGQQGCVVGDAVLDRGDRCIVRRQGDERRRGVRRDMALDRIGVDQGGRGVRAEQQVARAFVGAGTHGDHRIHRDREVGSGADAVGLVDRRIDRSRKAGGDRGGQVAARREPHEADALRIDAVALGPEAHQPHGALGILQGRVAALGPAFAGEAIAQDETGHAHGAEPAGDIHAFEVERLASITAAGRDDQGRAIRDGGAEDVHLRNTDLIDRAVDRQRRRLAQAVANRRQALAARHAGMPEHGHVAGVCGGHPRCLLHGLSPRGRGHGGGEPAGDDAATIHADLPRWPC